MDNKAETAVETETSVAPAYVPGPIPINRTFRFCDHRGQLLATISLEASIEVEPEPGISQEEAERRFRKGFRLTFVPIVKGKEAEAIYQSDGESRQEKRPKKVLTEEHKRRMQEGRKAAKGAASSNGKDDNGGDGEGDGEDDIRQAEIEDAAAVALSGMDKVEWRGKSSIRERMMYSLSDADWSAAIRWLLETGQIEKRGEKRGSQYRKI